MASSTDSVNVKILFVEGVLDDNVKLMHGMTACCIALPWKTDDSVYRDWGVHGSQTWILQFPAKRWIWRLVARAYRARRMVKVQRLTVRAKLLRRHWAQKHINRPLGQWQHVIFCDECRFMLFRIDNRIRVRRLVVEAMNEDCTHGNVAHGVGYVHVWGGISHMGKCHWSRLSPSSGGTLGFTWQGMVSQQLATGWW